MSNKVIDLDFCSVIKNDDGVFLDPGDCKFCTYPVELCDIQSMDNDSIKDITQDLKEIIALFEAELEKRESKGIMSLLEAEFKRRESQ
jgi:hypothetical protein